MRNRINKQSRALVCLSLLASLGACMTATPYQPYVPELAAGTHGGYSERQLGPDRYRVMFHGNELTSRDRVENYLLYRAAELTRQKGYDWFLIVDRHTEHDVSRYVTPTLGNPWYGRGYDYWRPHWRYYDSSIGWTVWHPEFGDPFWGDRVDLRTVESFEADAEIILKRGPVPANEPRGFDSSAVIASLGPTIVRPAQR